MADQVEEKDGPDAIATAGCSGSAGVSFWTSFLGNSACCQKAGNDPAAAADGEEEPKQMTSEPIQHAKSSPAILKRDGYDAQAEIERAAEDMERQVSAMSCLSDASSYLDGQRCGKFSDFIVLQKARQAFQKGVREGDGPSEADIDRGVHVENIYDFYDPEAQKVRIRKMDETVLHTRKRTSVNLHDMKLNSELAEQFMADMADDNVDAQVTCGNAFAAGAVLEHKQNQAAKYKKREDGEASESSDLESALVHSSESSESSDLASESSDLAPRGLRKSEVSTGSSGSSGGSASVASGNGRQDANKATMSKLRRLKSVVDTEATANWGHLVGKILHRKVLDFNAIKDHHIRNRRFAGEVSSKKRQGMPIWLSKLQGRCKAIVAQAWELSKQQAREPTDVMDNEWDDPTLLTQLFSTEYMDTLILLANAVCKLLASQPPLVAASPPCRVFGDLHGQLRDLLLFFHAFGMPGRDGTTFVFNGDFVDRGRHQLEVVGLLFALKVLYPEKVWLIRGNHEDRLMNEKYGFKSECLRLLGVDFGKKMFGLMQSAFNRLPLACLVANRALILHGGIGDGMWGLSDLWTVARPLTSEMILAKENSWLFNILWSDPIEDGKLSDPNVFGVHQSPRGGIAAQFAWNITKTFCARNGLSLIIRSHQSKKGSRGFDVMHSNTLVRVFSARDYEGHGNDSAVLLITATQAQNDGSVANDEGNPRDLLVVRPQVLRSVMKQRAEAARREDPGGALVAPKLGLTRRQRNSIRSDSSSERGSEGSQDSLKASSPGMPKPRRQR